MSTRVFVGNLSFDTTQGNLEALFSELGRVSEVFLPMDRNTGRPRGFAFVQFADASTAARAIERFNGHELDGRPLRVTEAEERAPRPPRAPRFVAEDGPTFGFGIGRDRPPKPKGSRRRLRGKKRSL